MKRKRNLKRTRDRDPDRKDATDQNQDTDDLDRKEDILVLEENQDLGAERGDPEDLVRLSIGIGEIEARKDESVEVSQTKLKLKETTMKKTKFW